MSLASGRALIADNLAQDFGPASAQTALQCRAFYDALRRPADPLVAALSAQWQAVFAEAADWSAATTRMRSRVEIEEFIRAMGLEPRSLDPGKFFFAVHTSFSFIAKSIARLVLDHFRPVGIAFATLDSLDALSGEQLRKEMRALEYGDVFRSAGLSNLVEGDFFSWYTQAWDPAIEEAVRSALRRFAAYDPSTLRQDPILGRDLLKRLYQQVVPRELRHGLGEYYTPDWLAIRLMTQVGEPLFVQPSQDGPEPNMNASMIDPACGSGTFLVLAIRAVRAHAVARGLSSAATVELVTRAVRGIDLNPLAVLASRVSYLLAIADLLPAAATPLRIPVYLADSVVLPRARETLLGGSRRVLRTVVGDLPLPMTIASEDQLWALADRIQMGLESNLSVEEFIGAETLQAGDAPILAELYSKLIELKRQRRDGIWARILRNAFLPVFVEPSDVVIGNPPWVLWDHLPLGYRQQSAEVWREYGLFVHTGMDTILGKGKKDIATLMTYVAADRFLKLGGRLGFVITQSVFKGSGAAEGFRRFTLPDGTPLEVLHVDDMSEIQPFEGADNRTTVMVLRKGTRTRYPVSYTYWRKRARARPRDGMSLEEAVAATRRLNWAAVPVRHDDTGSPWLALRKSALPAVSAVLGVSDYRAHAGVSTGGANAVFWLQVLDQRGRLSRVRNITEGALRSAAQVEALVETELLRPLIRPRDAHRWSATPSAAILFVQDPVSRRGIDEQAMSVRFPNAYEYLVQFRLLLESRAAYKRYFTSGRVKAPFYSMFDVGDYTLGPWLVVWSRIARDVQAAVVSAPSVPQETMTLVATKTEQEAHFVCGAMNSLPFRLAARAYSQVGGKSFGSPHLLANLRIPAFEPGNAAHEELALSAQSAATSESVRPDEQDRVDEAAAAIWGLDSPSLDDIRAAFAEAS